MRNFRDLDVWKSGIKLVTETYKITSTLPDSEKFGLISQMNRCSVSIPSNIAEGCSRDSQKDFVRFLQISLGSAFELETQLEISVSLGFLNNSSIESYQNEIVVIQKRINALISYARKA